MNGLLELMTTKMWMVSPDFAHNIRGVIELNLNAHTVLEKFEKKMPFAATEGMALPDPKEQLTTEGGSSFNNYYLRDMKEPFVNVMYVDGPISRNGGDCTYGSIDLRDQIMKAADNEFCRGHVFWINTPGGSAWAKNDFEQAINYAHDKGQNVLAFIDGTCASAGMYLASLCDEVYVMHPKDQLGCIGVMAAFYTQKDGSYCKYSNDTYHEIYDPESFDKNKEVRDIANDGNDDMLVEELAKLGVEFRNAVKTAFPAATDDHLHGKVFNAEDVYGILCDGQSTFGDVIARAFALANGEAKVTRPTAATNQTENPESSENPEETDAGCKPKKKCDGADNEGSNEGNDDSNADSNADAATNEENQNQENMKKYETIAAACGVEELVVTEEGTHLNTDLCEALQQHLQETAAKIENMNAAHAKALDELKAKHDEETTATFEANKKDMEALNALNAKLEEEKGALDKQLTETKAALAVKEQELKDMQARLDASLNSPSAQEEETPAGDAEEVVDQQEVLCPAYDPEKSPQENARIRKEFMEKCK